MKHRNVHRMDYGTFHGYTVQVRRAGEIHQVYVGDVRMGGRRAALRKALKLRREIEAKLPPRRWLRLRTHNNTGAPGVRRIEGLTRQGRPATPRYEAFWIDGEGRRRTRAFSISMHGEKAFELAVEARRRGVLDAMAAVVRKLGYGTVPADVPGLAGCPALRQGRGNTARRTRRS